MSVLTARQGVAYTLLSQATATASEAYFYFYFSVRTPFTARPKLQRTSNARSLGQCCLAVHHLCAERWCRHYTARCRPCAVLCCAGCQMRCAESAPVAQSPGISQILQKPKMWSMRYALKYCAKCESRRFHLRTEARAQKHVGQHAQHARSNQTHQAFKASNQTRIRHAGAQSTHGRVMSGF